MSGMNTNSSIRDCKIKITVAKANLNDILSRRSKSASIHGQSGKTR